jgi:hypothetical protein
MFRGEERDTPERGGEGSLPPRRAPARGAAAALGRPVAAMQATGQGKGASRGIPCGQSYTVDYSEAEEHDVRAEVTRYVATGVAKGGWHRSGCR